MTSLQTISNDFATIVSTAAPHIVQVVARRRMPATGIALGDGLIVTASHVVRKEKNIRIGVHGGETITADLVGRDPTTDLAVLKAQSAISSLAAAKETGSVGNLVLALGRPGHNVQATLGVLSAVGGSWQTGMGGQIDEYIQTDVLMYPGFSGGPLLNAAGEMIGLNTSALARGASLTIPAATVLRVVGQLAEHGHVKRAYLGISTQVAQLPPAIQEQTKQAVGLLVVGVEPGSPADKSGLVLGDTIVAFANVPIGSHDDLLGELSAERIGEKTPASIIRGGALESINVVLGEK